MRWNLDYETFHDEIDDYGRQGYRPTDLEIYGYEGGTKYGYVMVYEPDVEWQARWGLSVERMMEEMDDLMDQGYRLADFEASYPQGEVELSAIFVLDDDWSDWTWTFSRSSGEIRQAFDMMKATHRPVNIVVAPHEEGGMLYAWIWLEN